MCTEVVIKPIFIPLLLAVLCACASPQERVRVKSAQIIAIQANQGLSREQSLAQQFSWGNKFSDEEISPDSLKTYSTETLKVLLESLNNLSFYSRGAQPHLARQEFVFEELLKRKSTTSGDVQDVYQRYLAARLFDKAKAFKGRFPNEALWDVPAIIESHGADGSLHRVYDISSDSRTATVRHIPLASSQKILIAAINSCPVTAEALKHIESDDFFLQTLQAHGMILTIRFEPGGVAYRNSITTAARTYIAYSEADWPGIDFSRSPTFYFLKDGKIIHQFTGWDSSGKSAREFARGLDQIGLRKP